MHEKTSPYQCSLKRCELCLLENVSTIFAAPETLLNKRTEMVSKCCHKNKLLLTNVKKKL